MPSLTRVQTSCLENKISKYQMLEIAETWLANNPEAKNKLIRIVNGSGVENRNFVLPYDTLLSLNGMSARAQFFEEYGSNILIDLIEKTLDQEKAEPHDISTLVFTSCSVPSIPSVDAKAILAGKLSANISRIPIYQHGCAAGVVGLALSSKIASLGNKVLLSSVELCSLVFQPGSDEGTQLVAASIFADGGAAVLISPTEDGKLRILDTQSLLLENSRNLMGYNIFDDGFYLKLDRTLPMILANQAPAIVNQFLEKNSLTSDDVDYWLFHPGGIKILNFLKSAFNLDHSQCKWSYEVLKENGNMSSSTILYVLSKFLKEKSLESGKKVLIMGIGPGLTVELILLES